MNSRIVYSTDYRDPIVEIFHKFDKAKSIIKMEKTNFGSILKPDKNITMKNISKLRFK